MHRIFSCLFLSFYSLLPLSGKAQLSYADSIYSHITAYKRAFITDAGSPLKASDTGALRFFPVAEQYRVLANLVITGTAPSFEIQTHSGKTKTYRQFAIATFSLNGRKHSLRIYQSMSLIKKEKYRRHLFLPFNDLTNYEETYGGGRYIDLSSGDIKNGMIIIDFNKCYNPYCAYAGGYSCPIPPPENRLDIRIEAGEKNFTGTVKE